MSDQDYTPPAPSDDDDPTPQGAANPAVRPDEQEPVGPLEGLVTAAGAEASEEAAELRGDRDPEAEALLARMGVEDEGIESGQLLGLILVVLLSVAALALVLIFLFIIPFQAETDRRAEASAQNYEYDDLEAEAAALLGQYTRDGETYGLPIGRAMAVVAAEYGGAPGDGPVTRQDWNVEVTGWGTPPAVQELPDGADPTVYRFRADGVEEVGVDREAETVELIENDGEIDADAAEVVPDADLE